MSSVDSLVSRPRRLLFWSVASGGGDASSFSSLRDAISALGEIQGTEPWSGQITVQQPSVLRKNKLEEGEPMMERRVDGGRKRELHIVTLSSLSKRLFLVNRRVVQCIHMTKDQRKGQRVIDMFVMLLIAFLDPIRLSRTTTIVNKGPCSPTDPG